MNEPAIICRDLTRYYGPVRGIEGLDLRIERGEIFGFLGPNGAGKTTTIRLLLDLIRPTRGTASILGRDCRDESIATRRAVGYLPGEFNLYENLTGAQLMTYLASLRGGVDEALLRSLAERLGSDLTRPIGDLSHGNKQKLALLQAFAPRPELLILDEPTSGLDPLVRQVFHDLVREVRAEGRTVFLSSHDLSEVEKTCDRIASVGDGRLIAVEEVSALQERALRLVRLECAREPDAAVFAVLPDVDEVEAAGRWLQCRVRGPLGPLLAAASPFEVIDVISRKPSLEEFFLTLYGREASRRAE
ncbi:ABC transporter ATP-binding protein [bacterium]|nr:ABC transporter ATP-binding protein [bacterium]MBU1073397.1 ABC transporter ATP-binding protein [bacterium]MBU1676533.1 ABC transporter ATP-binding protein [bacterium]